MTAYVTGILGQRELTRTSLMHGRKCGCRCTGWQEKPLEKAHRDLIEDYQEQEKKKKKHPRRPRQLVAIVKLLISIKLGKHMAV